MDYIDRMKSLRSWALLLVLCLAVRAQDGAPTRFEAYSFSGADPRAVEETLRFLAGPDANVVMDEAHRRVLVVTTDENHARIAEAMRTLDVPPMNVRIRVRFAGRADSRESEASLGAGGEVVHTEGLTHTTIRVKPRIRDTTTQVSSDVTQTLLVASGREGMLRIGEGVPYLEWLMYYGLHWGYLQQRVNWQRVGSFLVVEPVVIGNGPMIRIRLTPELRGTVDGNPLHTRFAGVSTELVVQDGQSFQIGGRAEDADFYTRFLVGFSRGGSQESLQIFLTPEIMRPGALMPASP